MSPERKKQPRMRVAVGITQSMKQLNESAGTSLKAEEDQARSKDIKDTATLHRSTSRDTCSVTFRSSEFRTKAPKRRNNFNSLET